jgi:8-oxo-dGTP diphosphatase
VPICPPHPPSEIGPIGPSEPFERTDPGRSEAPTEATCRPSEPRDPIVAVGAVCLGPDGRVIVIRRGRPPSEGAWTLPGGRVEPGETLDRAVVREVREETAMETRVVCALGPVTIDREGTRYVIHEHLVVPVDDTPPRAGDDAADVRWVSRDALPGLGVRPDAIAVVDQALAEAERRSTGARPRAGSGCP